MGIPQDSELVLFRLLRRHHRIALDKFQHPQTTRH